MMYLRRRMRDYYSSWHCNMEKVGFMNIYDKEYNIIVYWLTRLALAPSN